MLTDVCVYDLESFVRLVRDEATAETKVFYNTESVTAVDENGSELVLMLESTEVFSLLRELHETPQTMSLVELMHYLVRDLVDESGGNAAEKGIARQIATVFAPSATVPEVLAIEARPWSLHNAPMVTVSCQFIVDFIGHRVLLRPFADEFQTAEDSAIAWLGKYLEVQLPGLCVVNGAV